MTESGKIYYLTSQAYNDMKEIIAFAILGGIFFLLMMCLLILYFEKSKEDDDDRDDTKYRHWHED